MRFILYGPVPTTEREETKLISGFKKALKKALGLSKTPGPKPKPITIMDLCRALEKLSPHEPLANLAAALGVSPRKAQELVKQMMCRTFNEIQTERREAERRGGAKSRLRFPGGKRRRRL